MSMTHYMELLMENSPYNLLIFMALPVILAETIAITELVLLFAHKPWRGVKALNKYSAILVGIVFLAIIVWLVPNVIYPLSVNDQWRGLIDMIAVISFALAGIPMIMLALLRLGVIFKRCGERAMTGIEVAFVSSFLVLSHVAMIAGMADPSVFSAPSTIMDHSMHEHLELPDMTEHHHTMQAHHH